VRNRVADDLGLDLFERAHVAVRVEQRQRVERGARKRDGCGRLAADEGRNRRNLVVMVLRYGLRS